MWYCENKKKTKTKLNSNRSQTKTELKVKSAAWKRKKKNIAPSIGRTIIQLHAIVYAVIYYDFRTTLWRLSV